MQPVLRADRQPWTWRAEADSEPRIYSCKEKRKIAKAVGYWADPIPTSAEFISGIPHKNSHIKNENEMFDVVRAIATAKMDTLYKIKKTMDEAIMGWPFSTAFPDLNPASGGQVPLSEAAWEMVREKMDLQDYSDYVKAMLNKHDGEAKLVYDRGWVPLTEDPKHPAFWDYQFAINAEV